MLCLARWYKLIIKGAAWKLYQVLSAPIMLKYVFFNLLINKNKLFIYLSIYLSNQTCHSITWHNVKVLYSPTHKRNQLYALQHEHESCPQRRAKGKIYNSILHEYINFRGKFLNLESKELTRSGSITGFFFSTWAYLPWYVNWIFGMWFIILYIHIIT